jgi:hypothetical protein
MFLLFLAQDEEKGNGKKSERPKKYRMKGVWEMHA